MIAKHVPMRSLGKSDFAGLAEYITDAQSKTERLGLVTVTNCQAGTVQAATDEVLATQHMNTRATGDKTFHLLVSFRAGEKPDADTLKAIEERICAGLGYGEHQRISAVHHDTDNLHIHIAINKIHPTRNTMHEPFQSYRTLGELCEVLERDYGLEKDNHTPARSIAEGRAADMERHAGVESLVGWIKRECLEEIKAAQSWTELHQALQANGLELRAKGNGFVIEAGDGTQVKASTVARELSKPKLEARFGPFEASPERQAETKAKRQYQKKPVRLAMERYGNRITVNGTAEFKAQIIRAAVDSQLPITFADPALESRRQALLKKENTHDRPEQDRGRTGRGTGRAGSRPAADDNATRSGINAGGSGRDPAGGIHAAGQHRKPDIGRIGRVPPPQSKNRLRALSKLGVVRIASGSEVLLPRDVPGHMEQQGTQPDNALRRGISGPGGRLDARPEYKPEQVKAMDK